MIHNGFGWGVNIKDSATIELTDVAIIGFQQVGISIHKASDITVDNLFVSDILTRDGLSAGTQDLWACVDVGGFFEPDETSTNVVIKNSIAAGCKFAGFIVGGHTCGATNDNFFDNVAHSIDGYGARIYPTGAKKTEFETCYEGSKFAAHHCMEQGIVAYEKTN